MEDRYEPWPSIVAKSYELEVAESVREAVHDRALARSLANVTRFHEQHPCLACLFQVAM